MIGSCIISIGACIATICYDVHEYRKACERRKELDELITQTDVLIEQAKNQLIELDEIIAEEDS